MADEPILPAGFEELESFVKQWARDDFQTRWNVRSEAQMSQIRAFYDAMLPRAEEALALVQPLGLDQLSGPEARLYRLVLALAHVAMAVEVHGTPRARYSPYPHTIRVAEGPAPFA